MINSSAEINPVNSSHRFNQRMTRRFIEKSYNSCSDYPEKENAEVKYFESRQRVGRVTLGSLAQAELLLDACRGRR